jgi:hypothetical protein
VRSSQDLLTVAKRDFAKGLDIYLGVNLGGVGRSVTDEISDCLE